MRLSYERMIETLRGTINRENFIGIDMALKPFIPITLVDFDYQIGEPDLEKKIFEYNMLMTSIVAYEVEGLRPGLVKDVRVFITELDKVIGDTFDDIGRRIKLDDSQSILDIVFDMVFGLNQGCVSHRMLASYIEMNKVDEKSIWKLVGFSPETKFKYIVFEGMDGAGKNTQSHKLKDRLGYGFVSFPQYETATGKLIRTYLTDENVTQRDMTKLENVKLDASLYSLDRLAWYRKHNHNGGIVFDRYYTSNLLYQTQMLSDEDLKEFCDWMIDFEVNQLGLPKADIVFCLVSNPCLSVEKIEERGRVIDKFETYGVQRRIYNNAHRLARLLDWKLIYVADETNEMKSRDQIHEEIMDYILLP